MSQPVIDPARDRRAGRCSLDTTPWAGVMSAAGAEHLRLRREPRRRTPSMSRLTPRPSYPVSRLPTPAGLLDDELSEVHRVDRVVVRVVDPSAQFLSESVST